jgi:hypothetical protein
MGVAMRRLLTAALTAATVACTTTSPSAHSRAEVTVLAITPTVSSTVGADTVFDADAAYRIEN